MAVSPLLEVPTDVWLDMRMLPVMPRFVQLPRYVRDAYEMTNIAKSPSLEKLRAFSEAAVLIEIKDSKVEEIGALIVGDDRAYVCRLRENAKGAVLLDVPRIGRIGRLVHRGAIVDRPALAQPELTYATVLRSIQHRAIIVNVSGSTIDYELSLDPRPRRPGIASATDVMQLLARPIEDRNRWGFVGDSPLASALRSDRERLNVRALDDIYRLTATTYIRDHDLGVPEPIPMPDLDTLSVEDVRAALERRVLATLRVTVTDPKWIAHLDTATEWLHVDERTLPPPA